MADSLLDLEGYDLLDILPNLSSGLGFKGENSRSINREPGGVVDPYYYSTRQPLRVPLTFTQLDREEVHKFLTLIHNVKGRLISFWFAAPIRSLEPVAGISTTIVQVRDTGFLEAWQGSERLYLKLVSGDRITRKISDVAAGLSSGDPLSVTLSSTPGVIALADIEACYLLLFGRFDTDDFTLEWVTSAIADVTTEFLELPDEHPE